MKKASTNIKDNKVTESSGNVFADLGLDHPEELKLKAKITRTINGILKQRELKQAAAAKLLGISQPQVSALMNGKLYRFSVEKLFSLLNALDRDIEITIKKHSSRSKKPAGVHIMALS